MYQVLKSHGKTIRDALNNQRENLAILRDRTVSYRGSYAIYVGARLTRLV